MFQVFDSLPSTNDYCLEYAKQHPNERLVCIAHEQTQGRGRSGKTWSSKSSDNLYLSYLRSASSLRGPQARSNPAPLALVVGITLAQLFESLGAQNIQLKWPNDILIFGSKIAGILIEGPVIGIGVNITRPIDENLQATGLKEQGLNIDKMTLAHDLINRLEAAIARFETQGFKPFMSNWAQFDCLAGHPVTWQNGLASGTSRALGINEAGGLLLADEPFVLMAGSVRLSLR